MGTNANAKSYEQLKESMIDPTLPCVTVVQILSGAAEDDTLDEFERRHAAAWLDRLVDEEGNPKDDFGRDPVTAAAEENSLAQRGSLTLIDRYEDRYVLNFVLSRRVQSIARDELRDKLISHLRDRVDDLIAPLYDEDSPVAHGQ